jgi:hypothetical protein
MVTIFKYENTKIEKLITRLFYSDYLPVAKQPKFTPE